MKLIRSSLFTSTLVLAASVVTIACSIQTQTSSESIPTGEETARAASERTRKAQESANTGLIYATSDSRTDTSATDAKGEDSSEPGSSDHHESASMPQKLQWSPVRDEFDLDQIRNAWIQARDEAIVDLELEFPDGFEPEPIAQIVSLAYSLGFERIVILREIPADTAAANDESSERSESDPATK